ncbi:MAG: hypothetical protein K2N01_02165 [Lachnospiraceae bacterium]|nr:hypothetical protein [Lachnospiraceae bacterium]
MVSSLGASVFFGAAVVALYTGAFLWKKEENRVSGLKWVILLAVLLGCYHTFAAALLDIVHLPVHLWSVGVLDLFPAGFFWYGVLYKKQRQCYDWKLVDGIFLALLAAVVVVIAGIHYGGTALTVNYASIDAATHFRVAMNVVNEQTLVSMFHDSVWNALLIEFLSPFAAVDYYYRWYVLGELINLALSAAIFYALLRERMKDWFCMTAGVALSLLYVIAYPLNSALFGFSYLGMSVTVIGLLLAWTELFLRDRLPVYLSVAGLMLGCLALFESYVLFMPVTFFAVLFCIFYRQQKCRQLVSWRTVILGLAVFLIPCVIGLWYVYGDIFTGGTTVSSAITNEGGCYRELYSNFMFFVPAAVLGYVNLCKRKENQLLLFLTPLFLLFTMAMFVGTVIGKASSYYYYKLYFPIWLILLLLNYYGIVYSARQARGMVSAVLGVWCVLVLFGVLDVEDRIQQKAPLMVSSPRAGTYTDLIGFNYGFLRLPVYSLDKLDLYHYAYREVLGQGEEIIPGIMDYEDQLWFQNVTNQRYEGGCWSLMDSEQLHYQLEISHTGYVLALYDSSLYTDNREYLDSLERIYENSAGFVAVYAAE